MVETLVRGAGEPTTVFAHGFAGGIPDSRTFAGGVAGTNVFYTARGHDGEATAEFGYTSLAADFRAVADAHAASRALGVSMGAGALCRVLAEDPDRFEKAVFFLPALVDIPRETPIVEHMARLDSVAAGGDVQATAEAVLAGFPKAVRDLPGARAFAVEQARRLCLPSMRGLAPRLAADVAVAADSDLAAATCSALVLGCRDDPAHPVWAAERLAAALPHAELHVYDTPTVLWTRRADLRARISQFLND